MNEFEAGGELCDEYRLLDQARLLRTMAGPGGTVYLVAERGVEYNDHCYETSRFDGEFQNLFTDRDEAQRAADLGNARKLREINLRDYGNADDMSSLDMDPLNSRVGQILGQPFSVHGHYPFEDPVVFPESATDDQMIAIARLFDKMQFFHVIEAEFGG